MCLTVVSISFLVDFLLKRATFAWLYSIYMLQTLLDLLVFGILHISLPLWQSRSAFSEQNVAQNAGRIRQDSHQHCGRPKTVSPRAVRAKGFCWFEEHLPCNDESSACARLDSSSCTDPTRHWNAGRRSAH